MISQNLRALRNAKFHHNEKLVMFFASLGGFLEFYDFAVFCFYAIYFAPRIFPISRISAIFEMFVIFAIGYAMKPLGILIYQKLGYRFSLKSLLNISVLLMTVGFFGIACVPSYANAGIYAGLIVLICRIIQGLACGIEIQSMIKYVSINLCKSRRRFAINGVLLGMEVGLLFGILLNKLLVYYLDDNSLEVWGWRIPFFISGVLSLISFAVRGKVGNFKVKQRKYFHKVNIFTMFSRYKVSILAYSGIVGIMAALLVNGIIFMPVYLHNSLNLSYNKIGDILFNAAIIAIGCSILIGYVARVIDPVILLKICFASVIVASIISYSLFARGEHIALAVYILVIHYSLFGNLIPRAIAFDFFPSYLRLTNISIVTHIGFIFFGGINPLITTIIITFTHSMFVAPCIYIVFMAIVGFISLQILIVRYGKYCKTN